MGDEDENWGSGDQYDVTRSSLALLTPPYLVFNDCSVPFLQVNVIKSSPRKYAPSSSKIRLRFNHLSWVISLSQRKETLTVEFQTSPSWGKVLEDYSFGQGFFPSKVFNRVRGFSQAGMGDSSCFSPRMSLDSLGMQDGARPLHFPVLRHVLRLLPRRR